VEYEYVAYSYVTASGSLQQKERVAGRKWLVAVTERDRELSATAPLFSHGHLAAREGNMAGVVGRLRYVC
jgi:hypothetical protein